MSASPIYVLVVDDEPAHAEAVRRALLEAGQPMEVHAAGSLREFRDTVAGRLPHLVLIDLWLPDGRADTVLVAPPENGPFPIVVMTSHGDEQIAASAIRQGALDYVVKSPTSFADMPRTVERTLRDWRILQEGRRAQEALRENERRLATLMSNLPGMAYRCRNTQDWPMIFVSEGCFLLTGYPAEALMGNHPAFGDVIVSDDRQEVWNSVQQALQQRQPFELTYRIQTAEGLLKWVWERGRGIFAANGDLLFLEGFITDISERKRAEQDRESALVKYRTLFDTLPLGITVADRQGRIIESNRVAEELLGLSAERQAGRRIGGQEWNIVRNDGTSMPAEEFASVRAMREQRIVRNVEMGLVKSPTETTWIMVTAAPVPLPEVGVVIAYADVGDRKRAEEALQRANITLEQRVAERTAELHASEQRLDLAFRGAQDGIWDWNLETDEVFYSRRWKRMLGYEETEIEHHVSAWKRLLHPEDLPRALELVRDAVAGKKEYLLEFRMQHKDGHYVDVLSRGFLVRREPGGPVVRIVGTHFDLTERKQTEKELRRHREQLEELVRKRTETLEAEIGERKRAAEALAEREETFSSIIGQAEDSITVLDADINRFVEFNAAAHAGLGYTREEFAKLRIADIHVDHSPALFQQHIDLIRGQGGLNLETRFRHRDGSLSDVHLRVRLLKIKDHDYMAGVWTDITARKRAEARAAREAMRTDFLLELHQRAPQLSDKALFDHVLERAVQLTESAIGFFHQVSEDQQNIILTTWNQEALKSCTAVYDAHYPLGEAGNWVDCVRQQRPVVYNDYARSPNQRGLPAGHTPVHRFMSIPVVRAGKVRIIFGVGNKATDYDDNDIAQLQIVANELHKIMEQRASQDLVRRSEERFRQLVETSTDLIWEIDATGSYSYVSPKVTALLGYAPAEMMGRKPFEFMAPAEAERNRAFFGEAVAEQRPFANHESTALHKNGQQIHLETSGTPVFGKNGELAGYRGIDRDVTERRHMEAHFRQAQKLEAIGQLASGIAHDFNNILAPITLVAGALKDRLKDDADREILVMMQTAARRGGEIVKQLLSFSRGQPGDRIILQLRYLMKEMLALMRETFPREITLRQKVASDLWTITADPTQLHQVLLNLCVNARDAMPNRGQLTLGATNVTLAVNDGKLPSNAQPGPYVLLEVADTGHGIPPEIQQQIFDPFFTTKKDGRGTGLGLSTVLSIVRSHGGFVTVHSVPPQGSTFRVYLPAHPDGAEAETVMVTAAAAPKQRDQVILVVDDERSICDATRMVLEGQRYQVLTASNGAEALALYRQHRAVIGLVLTDLMMPVMNGLALIRELRALDPNIKVIATSGLAELVPTGELSALGVPDILTKPCDGTTLLAAIDRRLSHAPPEKNP